jgi:hypothetical protein
MWQDLVLQLLAENSERKRLIAELCEEVARPRQRAAVDQTERDGPGNDAETARPVRWSAQAGQAEQVQELKVQESSWPRSCRMTTVSWLELSSRQLTAIAFTKAKRRKFDFLHSAYAPSIIIERPQTVSTDRLF